MANLAQNTQVSYGVAPKPLTNVILSVSGENPFEICLLNE